MTIKELIETLKTAKDKFGEDALVDGWGDDAAAIGIYFLKEVGRVKRMDWKADGWSQWSKFNQQFGATTSRDIGDETVFYAKIDDRDASIDL